MASSPLRVRPAGSSGRVHHITPESAGWTYVGFDLHRLSPGESASALTGEREACLVFISGTGRVHAGGRELGELGGRMSPFEGPPAAAYVPSGSDWTVTALTDVTLAVCTAPGGGAHAARVIEVPPQFARGQGSNTRYVTDILPDKDPRAESLLVVEVITPAGHSSSYPPHKHDRDAVPEESMLEETYYHRLDPAQGFAFQRVYTDDRSLDEAITIEDGDVVLVPRGYHPCVAPHGYRLYYLNVMAGPRRVWKFHNDPAHEWMLKG